MIIDNFIYNPGGEWIGWVSKEGQVYSVSGEYVGWLSPDKRILRRRVMETLEPRRQPPSPPTVKVRLPATVPLPPMMQELPHNIVDVFEEMPERLHTLDFDQKAPDMD